MTRSYKPSVRACVGCENIKKIKCKDRCATCYVKWDRKENPEKYREWEKNRYDRDRTNRLEKHKEWRTKNREKAYEIGRKLVAKVEQIKVSSPCLDCGNFFPPECMDFDHIDPTNKIGGVGNMAACRLSWTKILEEISKCELVCANCHRIRTKKRHAERRKVA